MYKKIRSAFTLILGIVAVGLFQPVNADWLIDSDGGISAGDKQDIVISLKSNPMSNPEMACLAVTFARSLSADSTSETNNVTLFVTLDGVSLADDSVTSSRRFKCETPWGEISLKENLEAFLAGNDDNMVVCPICWKSRYGDELPDYGVLPGTDVPAEAIGKMMLDADKILDF
jgi:sulfur relay (sulfurtransferase) complex TusBCD TusD component (DsrE family)